MKHSDRLPEEQCAHMVGFATHKKVNFKNVTNYTVIENHMLPCIILEILSAI